jgi:hypothetical protein
MRTHRGPALVLLCLLVGACSHKKTDEIPLKEVRNDAFGYSIRMPVGATQTENEKDRHVWSWSPDNHVNSYSCIIQPEPLDTFDADTAKKRVAEVRKGEDIKSAQALGTDGLVVELGEDSLVHYRETWCWKKGKTTTMVAICTGPAKGTTVTAMATSLTATK